jgi:hypothetical protein
MIHEKRMELSKGVEQIEKDRKERGEKGAQIKEKAKREWNLRNMIKK